MNKNVPLYYNEDKTAFGVLVSSGFGAGWSTWGEHEYAYDCRIIEYWLNHKNKSGWLKAMDVFSETEAKHKMRAFMVALGYSENIYFGGLADCDLEWVPVGINFRINEYDGAESLEIEDGSNWW